MASRTDFIAAARARGMIDSCTDEAGLGALMAEGPVAAYIGFDATADSLHVGSLLQIMLLRLLQRHGHKPIVLMGGGTTKVGDPSGRDETRKLLADDEIARNIQGIRRAFERFLKFGPGPSDAAMANNADWLDGLSYIPFLRDVGRHFSVNRMLTFDSVKLRLDREQPLSFLEFNYMVLQAYDFLELGRRLGCRLQMGGTDQWGNIVCGIELNRRIDNRAAFGLTTPLIETSSGAKMGKTAAGAVWLNPERLKPYDYWQFWRNTEDGDVGRFLRLFTDLALPEIARLEKLGGAEINEAKKILANEATSLLHGKPAADEAAETARRTFDEGGVGAALPSIGVPAAELERGIAAFEALRRAGLAASNGEARRLIKGGGAYLNDQPIASETAAVTLKHRNRDGVIKLSAGRKRHALLKPV
ncbi:MAG: tyrosine--tRNA ligase [Rhodospirillales bacterium]